jgi:hypothetical protein
MKSNLHVIIAMGTVFVMTIVFGCSEQDRKKWCDAGYCKPGGECIETKFSFYCECDRGYIEDEDWNSCVEDPGGEPGSSCELDEDCWRGDICYEQDLGGGETLRYCTRECRGYYEGDECEFMVGGYQTCCESVRWQGRDDYFCRVCTE